MVRLYVLAAAVILDTCSIAQAQYGGDPYRSYVDQRVLDHINQRRAASRTASLRKSKPSSTRARSPRSTSSRPDKSHSRPPASVPNRVPPIKGLTYESARKRLISAGWRPRLQPRIYSFAPNIREGNGPVFWKKGYREITESSGTGKGFCRFMFNDAAGRILTVVTAGEEDPGGNYKAIVDSHSMEANLKH